MVGAARVRQSGLAGAGPGEGEREALVGELRFGELGRQAGDVDGDELLQHAALRGGQLIACRLCSWSRLSRKCWAASDIRAAARSAAGLITAEDEVGARPRVAGRWMLNHDSFRMALEAGVPIVAGRTLAHPHAASVPGSTSLSRCRSTACLSKGVLAAASSVAPR